MSGHNPSYLQLSRHHIFYFRVAVPKPLRGFFTPPKGEIKQSLHTRERRAALSLARMLFVQWENTFAELRKIMAGQREIKGKILRTVVLGPRIRIEEEVLRDDGIEQVNYHYVETPAGFPVLSGDVDLPVMKYDLQIGPNGQISINNIKEGEDERALNAAIKLRQELSGNLAPAQPISNLQAPSLPATPSEPRMSELIPKFVTERKRGDNWTSKTEAENVAILNLFKDYFNDPVVSTMGPKMIVTAKEDLSFLPPNFGVAKDFRGWDLHKSIEKQKKDAQKGNDIRTISVLTLNKYLGRLAGFFEWLTGNEYIARNIAANKTIKTRTSDSEDDRVPFSTDDLKAIFEHAFFRDHQYAHSYQYWIPHIGVFTGARINEIAQLHVDDVAEFEDVWVIHIKGNAAATQGKSADGQRVKTQASKRLVPIHPKLIELGLLEFVESQRKQGQERLFPELKLGRDGYGQRVSRWFNEEFLRPQVKIVDPEKVFHSFRHTVSTHLGNKLLTMPIAEQVRDKDLFVKAVVGHKIDDITFGHYMKKFHPGILKKVIDEIHWDVDFQAFKAPTK